MASGPTENCEGSWTLKQMKIVETALLDYAEDDPERWEKIAVRVDGGRTAAAVKAYYDDLVEDVGNILTGKVELPNYNDEVDTDDGAEETTNTGEFQGSTMTDEEQAPTSHR